jgi:hypothetical protein
MIGEEVVFTAFDDVKVVGLWKSNGTDFRSVVK